MLRNYSRLQWTQVEHIYKIVFAFVFLAVKKSALLLQSLVHIFCIDFRLLAAYNTATFSIRATFYCARLAFSFGNYK